MFVRKEEDRQGGEAQGKQRDTQIQVHNNQNLYNMAEDTCWKGLLSYDILFCLTMGGSTAEEQYHDGK